jgi:hypothetical protein
VDEGDGKRVDVGGEVGVFAGVVDLSWVGVKPGTLVSGTLTVDVQPISASVINRIDQTMKLTVGLNLKDLNMLNHPNLLGHNLPDKLTIHSNVYHISPL